MNNRYSCDLHRKEVIEAFRLGLVSQGSDNLVRFMDCLAPLLEAKADSLGEKEVKLIEEIFTAQSRGDYLYLADMLQYVWPRTRLAADG